MSIDRLSLAVALALASASALGAEAPPRFPSPAVDAKSASDHFASGIEAFARRNPGPLVPVLVELRGEPGFVAKRGQGVLGLEAQRKAALDHHAALQKAQDAFVAEAAAQGVPLLPRSKQVQVAPGLSHRIQYRFSYLLNGFIAYVPEARIADLRALPGVQSVTRTAETRLFLDNSVNYLLGSAASIPARRLAVYGATEELGPENPGAGNGPRLTPLDGYEGQGMLLGVIDSGMDYEHPMLGGSGIGTPLPQRPPLTTTSANAKVRYWYNLGGASTLDDHGHGTHTSSTAGGYLVDGTTAPVTPTGSTPFGPTPGGVRLHGVAPQAQMMSWPVCNAAGSCAGDVELAIEDAVSPVVLTGTGDGGSIPTAVAKPVADVINMSLGGGNDPAAASSRVANSAVLSAGVVIVAAAGNDGPSESTVGAPCVGTLVMCVASAHDPGSTAGTDVLAAGSVSADACADTATCLTPAPAAETGGSSDSNTIAPGEQAGMRTYSIAGGGSLPGGSVSAHYVYVDRNELTVPAQVAGRIALLEGGTGTFAQIVNPVAALSPAVILLITDVTSATAVTVINGVPAYTISPADGAYLKAEMRSGNVAASHGAVSLLPLRVKSSISLTAFTGAVSDFSSRGPNSHANSQYRTIKPDVAGLGQHVLAATTPTGNPDGGIGMANASGYVHASGTSMASPHVAGAATLVRQRVRALGYDSTNPASPDYRSKRFDAATLVRALLTNTATDLRTGLGGDDPDAPNPPYTIHDVGAGLVDVDAALRAHAVMTSPTPLFEETPDEYAVPAAGTLPVPFDDDGNAIVPLPTASFGEVQVIGSTRPVVSDRAVTIRDIDGSGGGTYQLSFVDDLMATNPAVQVQFFDQGGNAPISQINVPSNGAATYLVRVTVDGVGTLPEGALVSWYVHATHSVNGQRLRMPFLYRAVRFATPQLGLPSPMSITGAGALNAAGCAVDSDTSFGLSWTYTPAAGFLDPTGYRLQRGTFETLLFEDDASEPLVAGENSLWLGSEQWVAGVNPDTASASYFVPDTTDQSEALTLIDSIAIPDAALGATLSVTTNVNTEAGFDYANIQASAGGPFATLGRLSGEVSGTLSFDISGFVGQDLLLRMLMTSDQLFPGAGWHVDHVQVSTNDFAPLLQVGPTPTTSAQTVSAPGTYRYRVAGLYDASGTEVLGPFTASACVCVPTSVFVDTSLPDIFGSSFEEGEPVALPQVSCN
jgi:subtilisin family serine protease